MIFHDAQKYDQQCHRHHLTAIIHILFTVLTKINLLKVRANKVFSKFILWCMVFYNIKPDAGSNCIAFKQL